MKLKKILPIAVLLSSSAYANISKSSTYMDCSLLAPLMFDFEREKLFKQKSIELFMQENKEMDSDERANFYASIYHYRKGVFDGTINTISYLSNITQGDAAIKLNSENYCEHHKW